MKLTLTKLGKYLAKTHLPFTAFTMGGWNIDMLKELGLNPTRVIVIGQAVKMGMFDMETISKKVLDGVLIDNENHPATPYDKLVRVSKANYKINLISKLLTKKIKLYFDIDGTLVNERRTKDRRKKDRNTTDRRKS